MNFIVTRSFVPATSLVEMVHSGLRQKIRESEEPGAMMLLPDGARIICDT